MNPNEWLEKAERLRSTFSRLHDVQENQESGAHDQIETLERAAIAHWLRQEFSDDPPEDTATLPLFVSSHL